MAHHFPARRQLQRAGRWRHLRHSGERTPRQRHAQQSDQSQGRLTLNVGRSFGHDREVRLIANLLLPVHVSWALLPIAIFAFGWALMVPVVTLLVLDLHPERRGMASSLQAFVGSTANGLVAGVIVPLIMHSTVLLATASLLMMGIGLLAWIFLHHRWPDIGRVATAA